MPRLSRIFLPGTSAHVIQRGNDRMAIFRKEADYEVFSSFLKSAAEVESVPVNGYVLMTTHFHLLVTPESQDSVPRMMRRLGCRYVAYFNRTYERIGTLWNGRYRSLLIQDERYWLTCLRYIEQNPVRAGIVPSPERYRWSSFGAHAHGIGPDWLSPHHIFDALGSDEWQRQAAYRAICCVPLTETDAEIMRNLPTRVAVGSDPHARESDATATLSMNGTITEL
jgi:putative transposase